MATGKPSLKLIAGNAVNKAELLNDAPASKCSDDISDPENRDFVEYLFRRYHGSLIHYLNGLLRSREEAEEILQETYLKVIQRGTLEPIEARARSYLFTTATNLVRDKIRYRSVRKSDQHDSTNELDIISNEPSPDSIVEWNKGIHIIKHCLLRLKPRCRQAFLLYVFEGLTLKGIADVLGVSSKTIERDLAHAFDICQRNIRD